MKKLLFALCFVFVTGAVIGQDAEAIRSMTKNDIRRLEISITKNYPGLVLSPVQKTKLEKLFMEKNEKIMKINLQNLGKRANLDARLAVQAEYEPSVNAILTLEQRIARKRKKK